MLAALVVWLQQTNMHMQHVMYSVAIRQLDLVCHLIDHFDYGEWTHPLYQQLLCAYKLFKVHAQYSAAPPHAPCREICQTYAHLTVRISLVPLLSSLPALPCPLHGLNNVIKISCLSTLLPCKTCSCIRSVESAANMVSGATASIVLSSALLNR